MHGRRIHTAFRRQEVALEKAFAQKRRLPTKFSRTMLQYGTRANAKGTVVPHEAQYCQQAVIAYFQINLLAVSRRFIIDDYGIDAFYQGLTLMRTVMVYRRSPSKSLNKCIAAA